MVSDASRLGALGTGRLRADDLAYFLSPRVRAPVESSEKATGKWARGRESELTVEAFGGSV